MNKENVFRLSRWAHIYSCNNNVIALFHSLNIQVIFLEPYFQKVVDLLKKGTTLEHIISMNEDLEYSEIEECFNELVSSQIIVGVDCDDYKLLEKKREENITPVGMISLYLILTDNCNLRCSPTPCPLRGRWSYPDWYPNRRRRPRSAFDHSTVPEAVPKRQLSPRKQGREPR